MHVVHRNQLNMHMCPHFSRLSFPKESNKMYFRKKINKILLTGIRINMLLIITYFNGRVMDNYSEVCLSGHALKRTPAYMEFRSIPCKKIRGILLTSLVKNEFETEIFCLVIVVVASFSLQCNGIVGNYFQKRALIYQVKK